MRRSEQERSSDLRVWRDRLTIALFGILIASPLAIATLHGFAPTVWQERRRPAPAPTLGARFPKQFEAWFDDRFGLRRRLVSLYGMVAYGVFGVSPNPTVLVGKDGWLFYASTRGTAARNSVVAQHSGVRQLTAHELDRTVGGLEQDRRWLEERAMRYLFVVAPDKHGIYADMLPAGLDRVASPTPWDQLIAALRTTSAARFVDLRPALRAARSQGRVYDKTDTHWNQLGAAIASREIVEALRAWFPDLPALQIAQSITWEEGPGRGLAQQMALEHLLRESSPRLSMPETRRAQPADREALLDDPSLEPYRRALNATITSVTEIEGSRLPRAVVIHDSFGNYLQPFLAERFSRAVFVHRMTGGRALTALIERERPDVVIDEIVERWLVTLPLGRPTRLGLR